MSAYSAGHKLYLILRGSKHNNIDPRKNGGFLGECHVFVMFYVGLDTLQRGVQWEGGAMDGGSII